MDADFPAGMVEGIAEFFRSESGRVPGADVYEDVFRDPHFFPLQRKGELGQMMQVVREIRPTTIMEIGADKGGGLYHWCKGQTTARRVIACEVRGTPYRSMFEENFDLDFLWLGSSSYDEAVVAKVAGWLGSDRIDVLFIDGDKSAFETDFDSYLPLMSANGIVLMHDVSDPPMSDVFQKLSGKYRTQWIKDTEEVNKSLERESQGIPPDSPHEGWLRHWRGRSCTVGVIYLGG